jgi:hypothetical protein
MRTRTIVLLAALGIATAVLCVWGLTELHEIREIAKEREVWTRTPVLVFEVKPESPGASRDCFHLKDIGIGKGQELVLQWEQFFVREFRPDGPQEYSVPGLSGAIAIGQKTCGFVDAAYYDFVYRPTGYPAYFNYPDCSGNPEARLDKNESECFPPRDWPQ